MSTRVNRRGLNPLESLPTSVRAVWGRPVEATARGPRPTLTLTRIVEAAVHVASTEGLDAVAMSRIARALDVGTMSLYRYVKGKDELLALMVDAVFDAAPAPRGPRETWRAALSRWAHAHRAALEQHPWALRVPLSGPPIMPNQVLWFERGMACLGGTGLSEADKLCVLLLVNGFVRHEALLAADLRAARASRRNARAPMAGYGELLGSLIDEQRFPALTALVASRVFDGPDVPGAEFEFGLERILDGVAVLVRER
jgi:AcrR family transcriptional regulator